MEVITTTNVHFSHKDPKKYIFVIKHLPKIYIFTLLFL